MKYKIVFYIFMAVFSSLQWSLPSAVAGSIISVQPLDFGTIILAPSEDAVEIDASSGLAVPKGYGNGHSLITGGSSGKLCVQCGGKGEIITLLFPDRIKDTATSSHYIDGFSSRSTPTPVQCEGTETIELHIGGLLHLKTGKPDQTYEFNGSITVNFDGPEQREKNSALLIQDQKRKEK